MGSNVGAFGYQAASGTLISDIAAVFFLQKGLPHKTQHESKSQRRKRKKNDKAMERDGCDGGGYIIVN